MLLEIDRVEVEATTNVRRISVAPKNYLHFIDVSGI